MKKQYVKPQIKEIAIRSVGFILESVDNIHLGLGAIELQSREGNSWEDEEEEEEDSMWK